jgi:ubiquinone/menaquinone biosynthesis C-methylase UbiE
VGFSQQALIQLYRSRAKHYDVTANLYYLIGFRELAYRKMAVQALNLEPGQTVVEVGCGTGLNFSLLQHEVGSTGRVIGIDLTDAMLEQAHQRVRKEEWLNVELIQTDAAAYQFPQLVHGILSTFAMTLIPEYDCIIKQGAEALAPSGRFVVLDLKRPDNLPHWLFRLGVFLTEPFGVSVEISERRPWEAMQKYLSHTSNTELFGGFAYISVGEAQRNFKPNEGKEV